MQKMVGCTFLPHPVKESAFSVLSIM